MGTFRWGRFGRVLLLLSILLGPLLGPLAAPLGSRAPNPLVQLLAPPAAHAQVADGSNFGSAVPCLETADQFATSCFVISDALRTASSSDSALYTFNTSGKTAKVTQGQVGSIYGLALDSGSSSGVKRLFMGAYAKRLAPYGPLGSGGIYALDLSSGSVTQYTTIPGTTNGHAGTNDVTMGDRVGTTSLGDMEISPDGKRLYVMNMEQDRLDIVDVSTSNPATKLLGTIALNYGLISTNAAVQADLHPMGLEFQPNTNTLYIGVIDGRARDGGTPRAYVLTLNTDTNAQALVLSQDLGATPIQDRLNGGGTPWYAWNYSNRPWGQGASRITNHPEPMLADIEFIGTSGRMVLGFRDRMGDMFYSQNPPTGEKSALAQGDALLYQSNGSGGWTLVAGSGANSSDFVNDGYVAGAPSGSHDENLMGALATTVVGTLGAQTTQMVSTAITPVNGESMGANWYQVNPLQTARTAAVELVPPATIGAGKATSLGDLENLCAAAYIGDRVWLDTNGNGIQDSGEGNVAGVQLALLDGGGTTVATATTDSNGIYGFAVEPGVAYTIKIRDANFQTGGALQNYILSPRNRGGDDTIDSDADQLAHTIPVPGQNRDVRNYTFDVGVMTADKANGTVGDFVWNDLNSNGVQDAGEPGVSGVTVNLLNASTGTVVKTLTTDTAGGYLFTNVVPGSYVVQFVPPAGINATTRDAGGNDATDSDADASTGWKTPAFTVIADTVNTTLDLGLILGANVTLTKSAASTTQIGNHLIYTLTYRNAGPALATAVSVVDTIPAGLTPVSASPGQSTQSGNTLTWNFGTLAPGATGTITIDTIVTGSAPTTIHNCATISTTAPRDNAADNTSCADTRLLRPNVYVQKSGTTAAYVGQAVNYTLAYGNNGDGSAPNTVLVDTLPNGLTYQSASPAPSSVNGQTLTWNLGTLAAGATGSISVATIANRDSPANVLNGASISTTDIGDTPGDNTSTTTTTVLRANVTVAKSGPATAQVDDVITYAITVASTDRNAADNVQLVDTLPPGVTYVRASWNPVSVNGQIITWSVGRVEPGASGTVYVQVRIDPTVADTIVNTADVSTSTPGDDPNDNQANWTTTILRPDLAVVKTGSAEAHIDDIITYDVQITNHGQGRATTVQLVDTLPTGIVYQTASPAADVQSGQDATWNLGTLEPGDTRTITVQALVTVDAAPLVTNSATVTTTTPGDDPGDNTSTVDTRVPRPNLTITKTGPASATVGDMVTYHLQYANSGDADAADVTVVDTLPDGLTFASATQPGATVNGQTITWQIGTVVAGATDGWDVTVQSVDTLDDGTALTNGVAITTTTPGDDPGDNHGETTTLFQRADVQIVKSSPTIFPVMSGTSVTYVLDFSNAGAADAKNVVITDEIPAELHDVSWTCDSGCTDAGTSNSLRVRVDDLASGATGRISVTGIALTDLAQASVVNTARITTTTPETDTSNNQSTVFGTVQTPDVLLIKTAAPQAIAGTTFTATLTYKNNGPALAASVELVDTLPDGVTFESSTPAPSRITGQTLTWTIGDLASGGAGQIALTLRAEADVPHATTVVNFARVTTSGPDRDLSNNTARAATVILAQADLRVAKTGTLKANAGENLSYTLTYGNTGPSVARNVIITDTLPAGLTLIASGPAATTPSGPVITWHVGDLDPGATGSITLQVSTPRAQTVASRVVTNRVAIASTTDDPDRTNNTSTHDTTLETADVQVVKHAPLVVVAGTTMTVTLDYTNAGPAIATNVVLQDQLPAGLTVVSSSPTATGARTPTWNVGDLAAGDHGTVQLVLQVPASAITGTVYLNTGVTSTDTADRDATNNQSQTTTVVQAVADLALTKTGPTGPLPAGSRATYTLRYTNAGPSDAPHVQVTDAIPPGFTFESALPPPASVSATTLTWDIGMLGVGATGGIAVTGVLTTSLASEDLTDTGQVASPDVRDPTPSNNRASVTTTVQTTDLSVVKAVSSTTVTAGTLLTYTLALDNAGPVTATNVVITDALPTGTTLVRANPAPDMVAGQVLTWNRASWAPRTPATWTVVVRTAPDLADGVQLSNTATVRGVEVDRDWSNNQSTARTTVHPLADLQIRKTGTNGPVRSGTPVQYTLVYTNAGPSLARAAQVVDTVPTGLSDVRAGSGGRISGQTITWTVGDLTPGATGVLTVAGTLRGTTANEVTSNTVTISGTTPDPDPSNNTSQWDIRVQSPDLRITKDDGRTTVQPGDVLTYTLTVHNSGPLTATGVLLTETPPVSTTVQALGWATAVGTTTWTQRIGDLGPGQTVTRTFTLVLPPMTTMTSVLNTAVVTHRDPDPTPSDTTTTDRDQVQSGKVGDTIWLDTDGNGTQGADEAGIPFVAVQLLDARGVVISTATTDDQGQYLFAGLRAGAYTTQIAPDQMTATPLAQYTPTTSTTPGTTLGGSMWSDMRLDIGLKPLVTTAVVLSYFKIDADPSGNMVRWGTLSEQDTDYFRVLRGTSTTVASATAIGTVASKGSQGADYRYTDTDASGDAYYWLVEVERGGHETVYGPVRRRSAETSTSTNTPQVFLPMVSR